MNGPDSLGEPGLDHRLRCKAQYDGGFQCQLDEGHDQQHQHFTIEHFLDDVGLTHDEMFW